MSCKARKYVRQRIGATVSSRSVKRWRKITVRGQVYPKHSKRIVKIQVRTGGKWKTIKNKRISKRSRFATKVRVTWKGRKTIRVYTAGHVGHRYGVSRKFAIRGR